MSKDTIYRQAAIDIERNATVDTNPSHFEAHQKFTQFMDDAEISSFGRWQWSNGFNTALTAVGIDLKKLPPAQPERLTDDDFETIRIHLNAIKEKLCNQRRWKEAEEYQRIIDRFVAFASTEPEQRWIPCSERLPEPRIDVWCNSDMGQMVGYYEENVETWYGRDYLELIVTAWMPLPEPYKGEIKNETD